MTTMRTSGWHRAYRPERSRAELDEKAKEYFAHLWQDKGYAVIPVQDLTDWAEQSLIERVATRLYGGRKNG